MNEINTNNANATKDFKRDSHRLFVKVTVNSKFTTTKQNHHTKMNVAFA